MVMKIGYYFNKSRFKVRGPTGNLFFVRVKKNVGPPSSNLNNFKLNGGEQNIKKQLFQNQTKHWVRTGLHRSSSPFCFLLSLDSCPALTVNVIYVVDFNSFLQ